MMEQQKFIETVEMIKDIAAENGNRISQSEIAGKLSDAGMELSDAQLRMVYAYLKTSKVSVLGDDDVWTEMDLLKADQDDDTNESDESQKVTIEDKDDEVVKMYQADIKSVTALSEEEIIAAMKRLKDGQNKQDAEALVNTFLKDVVRWVKEYAGGSVLMTDLIQEGNIGLMIGVAEFDYAGALMQDKPVKKLKVYLKKSVKNAAMNIVYMQESENNVSYKIAGRVNAVNDCAKQLAEGFGRKVTLEELAGEMNMSVDEIKEIVDFSSNKIEYIE